MGSLRSLRYLNVSTNMLTGVLPPSLGELSELNELHAFENTISGTIPTELGKLGTLRARRLQVLPNPV